MVHLLGDRAHHAGRLHGHSVVHSWRDHCTLVGRDKRQEEDEMKGRTEETMEDGANCLYFILVSIGFQKVVNSPPGVHAK